jgi:hypothetical protein
VLVDHQNTKIRRVTTLTFVGLSSKHPTAFSPVVRWSPGLARIPALSVRQPWAWLIINVRGHWDEFAVAIRAPPGKSEEEVRRLEAKYIREWFDIKGIPGDEWKEQ